MNNFNPYNFNPYSNPYTFNPYKSYVGQNQSHVDPEYRPPSYLQQSRAPNPADNWMSNAYSNPPAYREIHTPSREIDFSSHPNSNLYRCQDLIDQGKRAGAVTGASTGYATGAAQCPKPIKSGCGFVGAAAGGYIGYKLGGKAAESLEPCQDLVRYQTTENGHGSIHYGTK